MTFIDEIKNRENTTFPLAMERQQKRYVPLSPKAVELNCTYGHLTVAYKVKHIIARECSWIKKLFYLIGLQGRNKTNIESVRTSVVLTDVDQIRKLMPIAPNKLAETIKTSIQTRTAPEGKLEASYDHTTDTIQFNSGIKGIVGDIKVENVSFKKKIFSEDSPEVTNFLSTLKQVESIREHYTEEDYEFLKTEVIPKLLAAQCSLTRRSSTEAVLSATSKNSKNRSEYFEFNTSKLSNGSFLKNSVKRVGGKTIMTGFSVKVYPCGKIVYHLPFPRENRLSRIVIVSDKKTPDAFAAQRRLSFKQSFQTSECFDLPENRIPSHPHVGSKPTFYIRNNPFPQNGDTLKFEDIFINNEDDLPIISSAYLPITAPISDLKRDKEKPVTLKQAKQIIKNTCTAITGIIQGALHIEKSGQGTAYNDSGANIRVETSRNEEDELIVETALIEASLNGKRPRDRSKKTLLEVKESIKQFLEQYTNGNLSLMGLPIDREKELQKAYQKACQDLTDAITPRVPDINRLCQIEQEFSSFVDTILTEERDLSSPPTRTVSSIDMSDE